MSSDGCVRDVGDLQRPADRRAERRELALGCAVAIVAVSLLWLRYHSGLPDLQRVGRGDLANYYYPIADWVGRSLTSGVLPIWNPHSCSGVPLLATLQPAIFYPFTWLGMLLPTADALYYGLWVQVVLAGVFTAAALRESGASGLAAGLGGAFYAHACLLGNLAWPPAVSTMVWLPWLWLCVEKLVRDFRFTWWALLAGGTALQLLAGFPQYLVYGFYWLGGYTVFLLIDAARTRPELGIAVLLRRGLWMAAAIALGVGLAAIQLLPTAELLAQSQRDQGLAPADVHYLIGVSKAVQVLGNAFDPSPKDPTFDLSAGTGYLGIATLLVLVAAPWRRERVARAVFLVGFGALALLLSDGFRGVGTPLFRLFFELPTGDLFRTPERLRMIYVICAIVVATWGLDSLLRERPRASGLRILCAMGVVAALLAFQGGVGVAWRAALGLALAGLLLFVPRRAGVALALGSVWVAFVTLDLWLATSASGVLHAYPREVSESYGALRPATVSPELLARVRSEAGFARVKPRFTPFNAAGDAFGLYRAICYDPLTLGQWRELDEVLLPDSRHLGPLANPKPSEAPVFYDVASIRTIISARGGQVHVQENPDALPRAYLVERAAEATQAEAFLHIRDGSFDFHTGVLLEDVPLASEGAVAIAPPAIPKILRLETGRVVIQVEAERSAWLILTDTWYPGWVARVDGVPAQIHRANGLYRAVRIDAGKSLVEFELVPRSLHYGATVSLASLGVVVAVVFAGRRRA